MDFYFEYLDLFIICGGVGFIMYNVYNTLTQKEEIKDNVFERSDIEKLEAEYDEYLYVERELKIKKEDLNEDIYLEDHLIKKRKLNSI
jgi:regulator of sigma D